MDPGRNTAHPGPYHEQAGPSGGYSAYPPGSDHVPVNQPDDAAAASSSSAAAEAPLQGATPGASTGSGSGSGSTAHRPIRRRMRLITSCLECRRRKLKCDKSQPCTNCVRFGRDCLYLGPALDQASQVRLTEMKEKVGSLERQLERDVARSGKTPRASASARREGGILADDVEDEFAEERDLEPTELTALDITYEDDADGTDDIIDLGVQVGRMRITDRIGGLTRPRLSEEVLAAPVLCRSHPIFACCLADHALDFGWYLRSRSTTSAGNGRPFGVRPDPWRRPGRASTRFCGTASGNATGDASRDACWDASGYASGYGPRDAPRDAPWDASDADPLP